MVASLAVGAFPAGAVPDEKMHAIEWSVEAFACPPDGAPADEHPTAPG